MIFRAAAAASKINGRLAKPIQEVGFLNKHIVSKIIHTPIVYRAGNWAGCSPVPPQADAGDQTWPSVRLGEPVVFLDPFLNLFVETGPADRCGAKTLGSGLRFLVISSLF